MLGGKESLIRGLVMSKSSYVPIDIPDLGDDGLSDIQRDDLARSSARSLNFFGKKIEICLSIGSK